MTSGQTALLTQAQLRKIWASAKELSWDEAKLHRELERVIGVASLRDLFRRDAKLFIDYLVSEGASSGQHRWQSGQARGVSGDSLSDNVIQLATPAQWELIRALLAELGWTLETDYFKGCLAKATGRSRIRTMKEASMAITILQKMKTRRLESTGGTDPGSGMSTRPA